MRAITPPPDFEAMRCAIEEAGREAMNPVGEPDVGKRCADFELAIKEVLHIRADAIKWGTLSKRNPEASRQAHQIRRYAERKIGKLLIVTAEVGVRIDGRPGEGVKIGTPPPPNLLNLDLSTRW